jgi:hypothetical protein
MTGEGKKHSGPRSRAIRDLGLFSLRFDQDSGSSRVAPDQLVSCPEIHGMNPEPLLRGAWVLQAKCKVLPLRPAQGQDDKLSLFQKFVGHNTRNRCCKVRQNESLQW